ncbi:MAG TPA: DM13 domain-containing protein [Acidimicrobiales bacterium]|nr:DM13 domain-containing protein [Acidimicrobiales bacterium]
MTDLVVPGPTTPPGQRALSVLGLVAVVASALVGGNFLGLRETLWGSESPEARPAALSRDAAEPASGPAPAPAPAADQTVLRSQPWWQGLTKLEGRGSTTTSPFTVSQDALQWRAKWTCDTGRLLVRAPGQARPVVDAACPGADTGYSIRKGAVSLQVSADGPWTMTIDQQLDLPLIEPPLPAMTAPDTKMVFTGSLYRMDQVGTGTLNIYQTADGRHLLRLESFFVTANIDLELRFSPLEAPRTTPQFMASPSVWAAPLDITAGSLNFTLPPDVDPAQFRSVVVWCPIIDSAYAAVTLRRP